MTGPTGTLALDHFLVNSTPTQRRVLAEHAPQHLRDQYDAAARDLERASRQVVANGGTSDQRHPRDIPEWIRLGAVDALRSFLDGTARTCRHSPSPDHPQPVVAAAHKPGVIVCAYCVHMLMLRGAADRTCDGCGWVVGGVDRGEPIYGSTLTLGALVYCYGTCQDCHPLRGEANHG